MAMRNFSFLSSALFLYCFMVSYALTVRNLTTDQHALLEFKRRIIDPRNILADNWTTTTSVCNWIGVSCAAKHRRVKTLNLSNMDLTGNVPPHLGNLSFLVSLNLSHNNFHGHLPKELGQLSRLKLVELSSNFLTGEIPSWFGRLNKVSYLSLSNNNLTGTVSQSLVNMSRLEMLDLRHNLIYGNLPEDICRNLPNLEVLFLKGNTLEGEIPSNIGDCSNLQNLSLSYNRFSGIIPRSIGSLTKLKEIYLGANGFEGEIPWEMGNLISLEILDAAFLHLNGLIPPSIFNISSLKEIALQNNSLSGSLSQDMCRHLPNLERLELEFNKFSGEIPSSIDECRSLQKLRLDKNTFCGSIPRSIGNLTRLKLLNLGDNTLEGKLPYMCCVSKLEVLYLRGNNLTGNIPMEIGNLSNVIYLDLSSNELSGSIPATMGRLKNLQGLDLYNNKLKGSIPPEFCGLKGLYGMWSGDNELDGPIPTCLGDLTSLRHLFLPSNKFHSTIPSTFWSLKDILRVDLSCNYITGSLPVDIENLKVLTYLDLSSNLLSSDIPLTIGSLNGLQALSLSNNRLQGLIPESLGDLISLKSLDLSNNNLSGLIPKSLERLDDLTYFNVSFNRLEGEIPSGGPFSNFSAKSFVKNYALCGSPILQVQPCKGNNHKRSRKTLLHALRYALPTFASVTIVVAFMIVYRKRQRGSTNLAIEEDTPLKKWSRISYYQLLQGTDGFSENNLLGLGNFDTVYKGILPDGAIVAIKVFNLQIEWAFRSFDVECEVMRNILHRNLVKVITSCSNIDFKALVLEFMPNGSLEKWLYSSDYFLDILQRINIMIDVALALEYLHLGHPKPIIHCDLKPSNVLLDNDMVAHVGDFGIAKLLGEEDSIKQTMTLATIGYMAPEYGSAGIISVKSDVYSYGILLMEIFTRKRPTDETFAGEMSMRPWVQTSLSNGIIGVADPTLVHREDEYFDVKANCISSIMELALNCSSQLPEDRIDMKDVVSDLKNIRRKFLNNIGD
ncbi:hypothetical protein PTKIN_Ptkin16aG0089500 [Pterospermum kingtungense]